MDIFPMPDLDVYIKEVQNATYFYTLDLKPSF